MKGLTILPAAAVTLLVSFTGAILVAPGCGVISGLTTESFLASDDDDAFEDEDEPGDVDELDDEEDSDDDANGAGEETIPLKQAKLIIEHNATDQDTGFQGFIDGDGWRRLVISGPEGAVLGFEAGGALRELGLTELFFETVEPENAEVPIADVLAALPEGEYTIVGPSVDGARTSGTAILTHRIPAGPVLLTPAQGAVVPTSNLVMSWNPVTQTIAGEPLTTIRYQLIVEKDEEPHPNAMGKIGLSVYVPATVTSVTLPNEILEPDTPYVWEVLAIEESGNQTLSSGSFRTQ